MEGWRIKGCVTAISPLSHFFFFRAFEISCLRDWVFGVLIVFTDHCSLITDHSLSFGCD